MPPHDKPVTLALKDPELPVTIVAVTSEQPHRTVRSEGDYRAEFIDKLFTAMLNQRLNELARKPESSFLAAVVGRQPILRPIDVWFQAGVVKGERTEETLTAVAAELGRVARFGFDGRGSSWPASNAEAPKPLRAWSAFTRRR